MVSWQNYFRDSRVGRRSCLAYGLPTKPFARKEVVLDVPMLYFPIVASVETGDLQRNWRDWQLNILDRICSLARSCKGLIAVAVSLGVRRGIFVPGVRPVRRNPTCL